MSLYVPEDIKEIGKKLKEHGFDCYLVGGAIRNQLLNKEVKDYDLTTNAEPQEVMKLFKRVVPTGLKHGTVTILIKDQAYEITTYRIDGKYTNGRHPDRITFTPSIEEDLKRRDFTINSLALNVDTGEILDINGGLEDLENRIIRAIGEPAKRFDEDALRLVRACRFATQIHFSIEENTMKAMKTTLQKLPGVSKERISEELIKILKSDTPSMAFRLFEESGMLKILFPVIEKTNREKHEEYQFILDALDSINTEDPFLKLTVLLFNRTPEEASLFLKELKFSNAVIKRTAAVLTWKNYLNENFTKDYQIRQFISMAGRERIQDIHTLWLCCFSEKREEIKQLFKKIREELHSNHPFTIKELKINGNILREECGLNNGPLTGKVLSELLDMCLKNPEINNEEILIKESKQIIVSNHQNT